MCCKYVWHISLYIYTIINNRNIFYRTPYNISFDILHSDSFKRQRQISKKKNNKTSIECEKEIGAHKLCARLEIISRKVHIQTNTK